MLRIITQKRWKKLLAERDAVRMDMATLSGRLSAMENAVKEQGHAHLALGEKMRECQQRMAKMEKEINKRNRYGNTLASKVQVAQAG